MNKVRISMLSFTFLLGFIHQPNWVYNNFWFKADFNDSIPVTVPYWSFLLIYSFLSTVLVEVLIRLVKRHT